MPLIEGTDLNPAFADRSGWLILNPTTRRGYQILEVPTPSVANPRTIITSFDLDTLAARRRVQLDGVPITSGVGDVAGVGSTTSAGEIVHAVDRAGGRIYLAMSRPQANDQLPGQLIGSAGLPPDAQRPLDRFVAIDEAAFDSGGADFATPFVEPLVHARLHAYWVMSMKVTPGGKLLVLFAQPQPGGAPLPVYDHTLVQWDPNRGFAPDWERRLDACSNASLATAGGWGQGSYQWGLLLTDDALYTACQAAHSIGAVVRVALGADGAPAPMGGRSSIDSPRTAPDGSRTSWWTKGADGSW